MLQRDNKPTQPSRGIRRQRNAARHAEQKGAREALERAAKALEAFDRLLTGFEAAKVVRGLSIQSENKGE